MNYKMPYGLNTKNISLSYLNINELTKKNLEKYKKIQ